MELERRCSQHEAFSTWPRGSHPVPKGPRAKQIPISFYFHFPSHKKIKQIKENNSVVCFNNVSGWTGVSADHDKQQQQSWLLINLSRSRLRVCLRPPKTFGDPFLCLCEASPHRTVQLLTQTAKPETLIFHISNFFNQFWFRKFSRFFLNYSNNSAFVSPVLLISNWVKSVWLKIFAEILKTSKK